MDGLMFQILDFVIKGVVWSLQQYAQTPQGSKELADIEAAYDAAGGDAISLDDAVNSLGLSAPSGSAASIPPTGGGSKVINRAPRQNG